MPVDPDSKLDDLDLNLPQLDLDLPAIALAGESNGHGHGGGVGGGRYKSAPVLDDQTFDLNEGESEVPITPATDADDKDTLSYAFDDGTTEGSLTFIASDSTQFDIDPATGVITSTTPLDYESSTSYLLTVLVTDLGGNTDTATITVNLWDVNEFNVSIPIDTDASTNTVDEYAANDTPVGVTAYAVDADGTNNLVSYTLVTSLAGDTEETTGPFKIDPSTGIVTVRDGSLIDYETGRFRCFCSFEHFRCAWLYGHQHLSRREFILVGSGSKQHHHGLGQQLYMAWRQRCRG
jgi:Cadherin domain